MKRNQILLPALAAALAAQLTQAQEITPKWVQHINGVVNVSPADKIPILVKPTGPVLAAPGGDLLDGREPIAHFTRLIPFDSQRALLAIRENGIDEQDPSLPQAQKDLAAQYPDRSLIWLELETGKTLGVAWKEDLRAADLIPYDVTAAHTGYQANKLNQLWRPALDQDPDPAKRAIYSGYKHLILRYAPKADGTGWETTPTIAWEEPVSGLDNDGSITPEAGIGDGLTGTASEGGEPGSWRAFRWRNIRVSGFDTNTVIYAGGGTWRIGSHPQVLATTDGLTFSPIARVNDRDGARRNAFSLGGCSSSIVTDAKDPWRPNLQIVYHGHYPGTGWEARPNRYLSDPDRPIPSPEYNQQPNVRLFDQNEAAAGSVPAFVWEAAGKDGWPIDHDVDGVDRYDGNWNMSLDANNSLDYLVAVSGSSLDVSFMTYGWMAIHRLDGSIASGNSSYKLPFREDDVEVDYSNLDGGVEPDFDSTESWVDVVPDTTAPANQGKSLVFAAYANGGFGVFTVQNVAATLVSSPADQTAVAGSTVTIEANVTGSPNSFRWYRDGVPLPAASYFLGYNKAILTIVGVTPADAGSYQLKWTNPISGAGETVPATLTVTDTYTRWTAATDIFPPNIDPIPLPGEIITNAASFTLKAGGLQAFDTLNEETGYTWGDTSFYRYEQVAGDFDKRVRLVSLTTDPVSEEINLFARAGLMLRESANANTPTLEIFAANPTSASGNLVRVAGRALVNQVYSQTLSRNYPGVLDNLPNQWLRVRRVGNTFSFYVGTNGTAWTLIAEQYQSLPSTVLFGAFASPDDASGFSYAVAEFADYGDVLPEDTTAPILISGGTLDGQWVGLKFSEPINSISAGNVANYSISDGTITSAQTGISPNTVYLKVFGLTADSFTVTVTGGVVDLVGNPVVPGSTVTVKTSAWTITDIGIIQNPAARPTVGDDPYVIGQSVAISSDTNPEIEHVGGGSNGYDPGDFLHYLYRSYTGDFDVVVAVERFDRRGIAGGYANGGIHVRSALYFEDAVTDADRTKVKNYVNVTYYEASPAGRPAIELFRNEDGGNYGLGQTDLNINNELDGVVGYFGSLIGGDAAGNPIVNASPTVARWLRMTRVGDTFTASYSYDGVNWHEQTRGEDTPVPTLPATVLVGFGFQNDTGYGTTYAGNGTFITDDDGNRVWTQNSSNYGVLRTTHFGDFATAFPITPPTLNVELGEGGTVVLTWTGTGWSLQSATSLNGTFGPSGLPVNPVDGVNTVVVTPTETTQGYYRLSQ